MNRYFRSFGVVTLAILAATIVGSAQAVTISTVPVGYAGNAPDPATGFGAVPYTYRIGTYDITNAQYAEFLNAKASAADLYGLWNPNMDPSSVVTGLREGAISRTGSGPYVYSIRPGYANKPVIYVSFFDAVRFVNWLTNGQGNADTESGTYAITNGGNNSGIVSVPDATQRAVWAAAGLIHWLVPSEDEWYKAAYDNGAGKTYYAYPFKSDMQPNATPPPGSANSGNFLDAAYNYDGSGSYLSDVGAYSSSPSPFGSFDMGGDVYQWNDADIFGDGSSRGLRGGDWIGFTYFLGASIRNIGEFPAFEGNTVGFRVASVPEPSAGLLAALACSVVWCWKLSARHRSARRGVLRNDTAS